ncbi:MAG: LacI family transcriptional regulator [Candidatus Pacebacteria bacterium]|nr:LacI family transcriptional regulator [Candidatus Paceibacterota bacterium]
MADKRSKPATLADIAQLTGTNVSTVSRVLNDTRNFSASEDCRERILKTARELNYQPRNAARSLATGKSYCIGIILCNVEEDFTSPYFAPVLISLVKELEACGYSSLLMTVPYDDSIDTHVCNKVRSGGVDGFYIGSGLIGTQSLVELEKHHIPVVTTEHSNPTPLREASVCVVSEDCEDAYAAMAAELRSLGHRRVACFAKGQILDLRLRVDSLRKALSEAGIETTDEDEFFYPPEFVHSMHDRFEARRAAAARLDWFRNYSAVVCASDMTAFGLMEVLQDAGMQPGRDISVAGYNNLEYSPYYRKPEPFLTTIDPRKPEKGRMIARLLLELIDQPGKKIPSQQIDARFILRRSFAAAN